MTILSQEQLNALLAEVIELDTLNPADVTGHVLSPDCLEICISASTIGVEKANRVFKEICRLSTGTDQNLILNVGHCPFLSSFIIGQLVSLMVEKKKRGLRFAIVEASEIIVEVLNLAGMNGIIEVYPTKEDALYNFKSRD